MVSVTSVHSDRGVALYTEVVTLMASVLLPRDVFGNACASLLAAHGG